jgi:transcriptional regulatory protein RtcR
MATLAPSGRINQEIANHEIDRLTRAWTVTVPNSDSALLIEALGVEREAVLDLFDRDQLATALHTCLSSRTMSAAGRTLFAHFRRKKKSSNDADRLRKYLARFGLRWDEAAGKLV